MKKIQYKPIRSIVGLLLLAVGLFWSCEDTFDQDAFITDVSVNMESFSIQDVDAEIDNQNSKISLILPYGTNIKALTPDFTIPEGASVMPEKGASVDFTTSVQYQIMNGNIYKKYNVEVKTERPILSFKINDLVATINYNSKIISLIMPEGTDLTGLKPEIQLSQGVSIAPQSESVIDFTDPVTFTVSSANISEEYTALISTPGSGPVIAFLGVAANVNSISNSDELAASRWVFENYPGAQYLSFTDILNGASLEGIDVIWWHYDEAQSLPAIATNTEVVSRLKAYRAEGGNLLLTTFASQYLDVLGIIPAGKGPNNVFGDFLPNGGVDGNSWGMSFVGRENHPMFLGLETYETGKANLLEGGTFRLNHTAWWFLPEWGGYGDGAGWREQTGGNNLASEGWDNGLNGRVTIAEFPGGTAKSNVVVISMGAYDWFNENDAKGNPSQPNRYIENIKTLTANTLKYLADK